jgi:nitroreductase
MEFMEVVRKRRSIRKYMPKEVSHEKLANILEAARLAPSGANRQSWKFIVIREKDAKMKVAEACSNQLWMGDAGVIIVGCWLPMPGVDDTPLVRDVTIAMEHIVLAAVNEGLGVCWIGASNVERVRALRPILRIPPEVGINALVTIGYPAEPPRQRTFKKLEEIVCYEFYK